ncbi:hypothetical protein KW791_00460 [Candidatus Parcubacteria bacterium]|nr:hypothetical protein [Candidatus Parcubacteria bacterium]
MGRAKKGISDAVRRNKTSTVDMAIEERLASAGRRERHSIIYLGELVERHLRGEIGAILKALTAGRISTELGKSSVSGVSAERVLGRLEMAESLWNDLEQFVHDKDKLISQEIESIPKEDLSTKTFNYHP